MTLASLLPEESRLFWSPGHALPYSHNHLDTLFGISLAPLSPDTLERCNSPFSLACWCYRPLYLRLNKCYAQKRGEPVNCKFLLPSFPFLVTRCRWLCRRFILHRTTSKIITILPHIATYNLWTSTMADSSSDTSSECSEGTGEFINAFRS